MVTAESVPRWPGGPVSDFALEIKKLCKRFTGAQVLTDVDVKLRKGSILGLVGENGAGKSTMMNILGGIHKRSSGEIFFEGKPFVANTPIDAEKAGIAFIHQELNVFTNLTVAENIFLDGTKGSAGFFSYNVINTQAKGVLGKLGITINVKARMEDLSMGEKQMVEIAKAIAKNAKVIIFDEPTTSLSSTEKALLFEKIRELARQRISMIYISHTIDDVLAICDEVAVLRDGFMICQKGAGSISKEEIISKMVGREMTNLYPFIEREIGGEVMRLENVSMGRKLTGISCVIRAGEIVGLFGLMGSGRTELARAIFGLESLDAGKVYFNGTPMADLNPMSWVRKGMAFVTENRRDEGLLLPKSVKENLIMASLKQMGNAAGAISYAKTEQAGASMVERLNIKTENMARQSVRELSGGNQQKVVIGKWLLKKLRLLILDEPTRGIDVGAKYEIYTHMNSITREGAGILFISSEIEELMGICDRILVLSGGRLSGEHPRSAFDSEKIMRDAIGYGAR